MITPDEVLTAAMWVTGRESGIFVKDPWPSKWGISLQYHSELTLEDIQNMTQTKAANIFVEQYWMSSWNALPVYITVPLLSFAVVDGPGSACHTLQLALGVPADGRIGPETIAAASAVKPEPFIEQFFGACMERFMESPRWATDGVGWCRRQMAASLQGYTSQ